MKLPNRLGLGRRNRPQLAGDGPALAEVRDIAIRTLYHDRDKAERDAYQARLASQHEHKGLLHRLGLRRKVEADPFDEIKAPVRGNARAAPPPAVAKPAPTQQVKPKKRDRGDMVVAALGVTLGLTCALFPWYIFFNQEKFGVRGFVFEGRGSMTSPSNLVYQPELINRPFSTGEVPRMNLDFFPTATLPAEEDEIRAVPASEQPFPSDLITFRLVHVANGRAMIQDEDGLWVVQRGSRLPDASEVASIEQRDGNWVLVTTLDKVVELQR